MAAITVPKLNYFKQVELTKNVFTGSTGTDPDRGCINTNVFDYKVYEKDGNSIVAECRVTPPWNENKKNPVYTESFELSEEGIENAAKWLSEKCDELL